MAEHTNEEQEPVNGVLTPEEAVPEATNAPIDTPARRKRVRKPRRAVKTPKEVAPVQAPSEQMASEGTAPARLTTLEQWMEMPPFRRQVIARLIRKNAVKFRRPNERDVQQSHEEGEEVGHVPSSGVRVRHPVNVV